LLNEDSPGVGRYNPNANVYLRSSQRCSITRAKRFRSCSSANTFTELFAKDKVSLTKHICGGIFSKAKRFHGSVFISKTIGPGPANYFNTLNSKDSPKKRNMLLISFTRARRRMEPENIRGPGPNSYTTRLMRKGYPITLPKVLSYV